MSETRIVIAPAEGAAEIETLRVLFLEYRRWLGVDLCFQDFEAELAGLPGAYVPPRGGLWLARVGDKLGDKLGGRVAGCVALRPLERVPCEMKRLWVRPDFRGLGLGRRLARTAIRAARAAGHRALCLDTLANMAEAHALYESLGFREIPPYYDNPLEGVRYMRLDFAG